MGSPVSRATRARGKPGRVARRLVVSTNNPRRIYSTRNARVEYQRDVLLLLLLYTQPERKHMYETSHNIAFVCASTRLFCSPDITAIETFAQIALHRLRVLVARMDTRRARHRNTLRFSPSTTERHSRTRFCHVACFCTGTSRVGVPSLLGHQIANSHSLTSHANMWSSRITGTNTLFYLFFFSKFPKFSFYML